MRGAASAGKLSGIGRAQASSGTPMAQASGATIARGHRALATRPRNAPSRATRGRKAKLPEK